MSEPNSPSEEKATEASPADTNTANIEVNHPRAHWSACLKITLSLLAVWFVVSFGAGILFRDWLDQFMLGGYPLGFWFAQQGSIYVFIALIFVYTFAMRRLERKCGLED